MRLLLPFSLVLLVGALDNTLEGRRLQSMGLGGRWFQIRSVWDGRLNVGNGLHSKLEGVVCKSFRRPAALRACC